MAKEFVGPVNLASETLLSGKHNFGENLYKGEGEAMASYVSEGKRIPRRGEVGLTSEQIQGFESQGFVMSASRHSRMEAVRLRKEKQVYEAKSELEAKNAKVLAKEKQEQESLAKFRMMIQHKKENLDQK